jgi:hypothetical protein
LASDQHLLAQYKNESSWSIGYNMFADHWLQTGLISQSVRVALEEQKEILAHVRLQILTAQSTYLEKVNFTVAPPTFSVPGVGLPLDSLRPDNVTYSAFFLLPW